MSTLLHREDNKNLKTQVEQLKLRVGKLKRRIVELEETNEQHGQLQEKMRTRLKQMDSHSQHSGQQVGHKCAVSIIQGSHSIESWG